MRPFLRLLRNCAPLSTAAERAVAATVADWRYENHAATSLAERLWVNVRSTLAVVRAVVWGECRAMPSASSPFFVRLFVSVAVVAATQVFFRPDPFLSSGAPFLARWLYQFSTAGPFVLIALPVLAFLAEVSGRRARPGPTLGTLAGLAALICVGSVLVSESRVYQDWADWRYLEGSPAFSIRNYGSLLNPELSPLRFLADYGHCERVLILSLFACSLTFLARCIRETSSMRGWLLGLSPVLVFAGVMVLDLQKVTMWLNVFRYVGPYAVVGVFAGTLVLTAAAVRHRSATTRERVTSSVAG